jgi:hypothetical protein
MNTVACLSVSDKDNKLRNMCVTYTKKTLYKDCATLVFPRSITWPREERTSPKFGCHDAKYNKFKIDSATFP